VTVTRLDLKVGFGCNNLCRFCVQGDKRARYPSKSTDELMALLEAGRAQVDEVVFTGGEVTLRVDLPELVEHARGLGYRVIQLQTNGRMLSVPRYLDQMIDAGVTEVSPAIHGADAATHDALTGRRGSWRQSVKGARDAARRGLPVLINSVITRQNVRQLPDMARLFVALGARQFQLAFVHALGSAAMNFEEIVPRLPEASRQARLALAVGRRAGVRCMTEAIPLCFLRGYEAHAAEWVIPRTKIFDADRVVEDYTAFRLTRGKLRGPPCAGCSRAEACEGPWREYPEAFGWGEFRPY